MVKIRLQRVGAKNRPSYRLVIADIRAPRDGAFIDIVGHYNPLTDPETLVVDEEKVRSWLKQGAQPTATATRLLSKVGIVERPKIPEKKAKAAKEEAKAATEKPKTVKEEPKAAAEKPKTAEEPPKHPKKSQKRLQTHRK